MLKTKDVERLRFELMAREHVQRIGARIRERREELGLSQGAVADQLPPPIDGNYVSRWERGLHKPNDDTLDKLAEILQTTRSYFLTDSEERETPDLLRANPSQLDRLEAELAATRVDIGTLSTQLEDLQRLTAQIARTVGVTNRSRKAK